MSINPPLRVTADTISWKTDEEVHDKWFFYFSGTGNSQLAALTDNLAEMDMQETYIRQFIDKAKKHVVMETLTPELLKIFVRRIETFEKEVKYSQIEGNHIDIYFTFHAP